jgi:surfeit locus 1 family protein
MRVPVIPTIVVAAAIATMVALGFWQLGRGAERDQLKRAMIERPEMPVMDYPFDNPRNESYLYRKLRANCDEIFELNVVGGRDASGRTGWRQIASCLSPSGQTFQSQIGVASKPDTVADWAGGSVEGIAVLAPDRRGFWERLAFTPPQRPLMIVADEPKAGLLPSQRPDPADYENTSWGYAGQWFFFALTALVIYILALKKSVTGTRRD